MSISFRFNAVSCAIIIASLFFTQRVSAEAAQAAARGADVQRNQAQQIEAAQDSLSQRPDVFTAERSAGEPLEFPVETPCFTINEVAWRGAEPFRWLTDATPVVGACLGTQGVRQLQDGLTRALMARGYITSRALIPPQNLAGGKLTVDIVAGRVANISEQGGSIGWLRAALPIVTGDLLNVRDLDQALENMRRLPGQAGVAFDLLPGAELGDTDIVIRHPAVKPWRMVLTAGNTGVDASGRYQLGAIIALDSPLHLYDQLIATYNTDAHLMTDKLGSQAKSVSWSVPFGYAALSLGASEWTSHQALTGDFSKYQYASRTRRVEAGFSYVPYRSGSGKGTLQLKLNRRMDATWLGGVKLVTQARDLTGYNIGFGHRQSSAAASWGAGADIRGSLPGLSHAPGYVADRKNWDGRYQIVLLNADLAVPFAVGSQRASYRGSLLGQNALMSTPSSEYLSIGDRYSVRGFDGNSTLAAESGWVWRNELAAALGVSGQDVYAALDAGRVIGKTIARYEGRTLVGSGLGLRGNLQAIVYDVLLGTPLVKSRSINTSPVSLNFFLRSSF